MGGNMNIFKNIKDIFNWTKKSKDNPVIKFNPKPMKTKIQTKSRSWFKHHIRLVLFHKNGKPEDLGFIRKFGTFSKPRYSTV